jgi:glyoxylase I family protein
MTIKHNGLHHLAIRVTDLNRATHFYNNILGFETVLEAEGLALLNANGTLIGVRGGATETDPGDRFDPYRVGLDHLALAVANSDALADIRDRLDTAAVKNNGIQDDALTGGKHITFYDPDGIAWEFYWMAA